MKSVNKEVQDRYQQEGKHEIWNASEDVYVCNNGKKLMVSGVKKSKSKTGYESEKTCYACEDCNSCQLKSKCIKGNNSKIPLEERTKHLEISRVVSERTSKISRKNT